MKKILLLFVLGCLAEGLRAQPAPQWMRYPAISPDGKTIAFQYGGDIYLVPAKGGEARLFAGGPDHACMPVWSHDGTMIAYASDRAGNFDVYVRAVAGGPEVALTCHSADEFPFDFSADHAKVLFGASRSVQADSRQFPLDEQTRLFEVPVRGGRSQSLLSTPVTDVRVSPDGRLLVYEDVKCRENRWRKHQASAAARDIWLYNTASGTHQLLTTFAGEDRNAVFAPDGKSIYYLSERSGSFNVYQQTPGDTTVKAITNHQNHPVRFLSIARNETLCYGYGGQLYIREKNKAPVRVAVRPIRRQDVLQQQQVSRRATAMAVSPSGREIAFIAEGDVFVTTVDSPRVRQLTFTAAAEAGLSFSPDGQKLVYASERNGRWEIVQATAVMTDDALFTTARSISEQVLIGNQADNDQPLWSPNGEELAYIENHQTLKIFHTGSREARTLLSNGPLVSEAEHDQYFCWSPDGKRLLVQFPAPGNGNQEVGVIEASGVGGLVNLSQSGFDDSRPAWTRDGRMITWLSDREGLHGYGRSGKRQTAVYAVFPGEEDWRAFRQVAPAVEQAAPTNNKLPGMAVNWDRVKERRVRLSAGASLVSDALVSHDGHLLYFLAKLDNNYDLWCTDLQRDTTWKLCALNTDAGLLQWGRGQRYLYLLAGESITRIDTQDGSSQVIPTTTERLVELPSQRRSIFDHVWHRVATSFYTQGLHGANWTALKEHYAACLPGIFNNYDLAELLNEMLGELNVSHTGVTYKKAGAPAWETASLGVLYDGAYTGEGMRIAAVLDQGPLDLGSGAVPAGTVIEAVDNVNISRDKDIDWYLKDKAGKKVLLRLRKDNTVRDVWVTALSPAAESELLYSRWVKRNAEEVAQASNGTVGYVHLYRMNDAAYRHILDAALGKLSACKALIVDTRYNRGGNLALELEAFLSGVLLRTNANDLATLGPEPASRWTRPSVVLANEANYSDGHCFVYDYQLLHMGPLIGMPVPGSCTWMSGSTLSDRTLSFAIPVMGVKDRAGRYLENRQTEPDKLVRNEPEQLARGRDQQLEAAIQTLQQELLHP